MYTHVRVCTRVPASAEQSRADRIPLGESAISRERSRVDRDTRVLVHVRDSASDRGRDRSVLGSLPSSFQTIDV